jgi:hypothetical protein
MCQMPAMGLESERNQSNSVLLSFVQGRRSLMVPPQRQGAIVGDPGMVAST